MEVSYLSFGYSLSHNYRPHTIMIPWCSKIFISNLFVNILLSSKKIQKGLKSVYRKPYLLENPDREVNIL